MGKYDDIIDLPHPVSASHPPMPRSDRAAQFLPFAALSGYEDRVKETARLMEERPVLGEDEQYILDRKMKILRAHLTERPEVAVICFRPDQKKSGGACVTVKGCIKKIDDTGRAIWMEDGGKIPFDEVIMLEGEIFSGCLSTE